MHLWDLRGAWAAIGERRSGPARTTCRHRAITSAPSGEVTIGRGQVGCFSAENSQQVRQAGVADGVAGVAQALGQGVSGKWQAVPAQQPFRAARAAGRSAAVSESGPRTVSGSAVAASAATVPRSGDRSAFTECVAERCRLGVRWPGR